MYFRDPFKLVPIEKMADIADKFTRNEILSSNEIRAVVGRKPSDDPRADMLINSNLNHGSDIPSPGEVEPTDENQVNEGIGNIPVKDLIVKGGNQFED